MKSRRQQENNKCHSIVQSFQNLKKCVVFSIFARNSAKLVDISGVASIIVIL